MSSSILDTLDEPTRSALILVALAESLEQPPLSAAALERALSLLGQPLDGRTVQILRARALVKTDDDGHLRCRRSETVAEVVGALEGERLAGYRAALLDQPPALDARSPLGLLEEGLHARDAEVVVQALALLRERGDERDVPLEQMAEAGELLGQRGEYEAAQSCYTLARERSTGDTSTRFALGLGTTLLNQGHYSEAAAVLAEALGAAHDVALKAEILGQQGWLAFRQDHLDEAERCYEEALRHIPYDRPDLRARLFNRQAGVMYQRQDLARAYTYLQRAMDALAEAGDLLGMAQAHNNLGSIYQMQGDYENGMLQREEALRLFDRLGHSQGKCDSLLNLAGLYQTLGLFEDSYPYLRQTLELAQESQQRFHEGLAWGMLGWTLVNLGSTREAHRHLQTGLDILQALGAEEFAQDVQVNQVDALLDDEEGWALPALVEMLLEDSDLDNTRLGSAWRMKGELLRRSGDHVAAQDALELSLSLLDPLREPYRYLISEIEQVRVLDEQGHSREARYRQNRALQRWSQTARAQGHPPYRLVSRLLA